MSGVPPQEQPISGGVGAIPTIHLIKDPATEIAAHLERLITTGRLQPHSRLPPERVLAEHLAVSRPTLRDALLELEHKRLVERVQGRGTVVLEPPRDAWDLRAMTASTRPEYVAEVRYSIEPEIARLAALRATGADLIQIRATVDSANEAQSGDASLDLDIEFHLAVAHASHNPLMESVLAACTEWTREERFATHASPEWRSRARAAHSEIYAAVESRDAERSRKAMSQHITEVRERIDGVAGRSS